MNFHLLSPLGCYGGEVHHMSSPASNICYYFSSDELNQGASKQRCRQRAARLAIVNTTDKQVKSNNI